MTVIRRLDLVLEPKKKEILELKESLSKSGAEDIYKTLDVAVDLPFYNISKFNLKDLKSETNKQNLKKNFEEYLNGFSDNVKEILAKFKFFNQLDTMTEAGILGDVIEKFTSSKLNLSPYPVTNSDGEIIKPALDNHAMGTLFEELIRKFNEENNEEAGEHFTPRDVVELMADIALIPAIDDIKDGTYTIYDGACGTLGMGTVAAERFKELAKNKDKNISVYLTGQEVQPETYAISKADMLIKGENLNENEVFYGSTLSSDGAYDKHFDFMLSNPPYGKNWKTDLAKLGAGSNKDAKKNIIDKRFITEFAGDGDYSMIPAVSDGQLLFLLNNIAKMKKDSKLGSRIVEVHNGSALFTGDAGSGESNARRYMVENDLIEAIIQLPENMFYNTGITTYIWVLSNRKPEERKGKIQLIDASNYKRALRKNMGKKNCELSNQDKKDILKLYLNFAETEESKILNNSDFGYYKIVVNRPEIDENDNFVKDKKGKVKFDKSLKDTEIVPMNYEGGIDAYMEKEVLPYYPYAEYDKKSIKIGYEINFTKYFYKPKELESVEIIVEKIKVLEKESDGMLKGILEGLHE
ncbi:site-specific dna-methyltransferase (adenine-specific) [Ligilactobacillus ceti DSM 22408]|uniref:site-specific DNA-methyltransferase (adenine-specific) n=2 Tax=Ligilactobacillus TaxID=2767887 RepID=A0A0R2KH58_9LACO|nr:site-specific dna-methyltransferase (adenine-specific) [Ligilactobacillus ceti DSM 22408]